VRVNALAPGYVLTEINRDFFETPDAEKVIKAIPMGRVGQVEDLDGAILFLASPASRFMTGAVLLVDGGHAMAI
jgi:NAD(P)-dependent dehydrogenase (short-subunit alcohol dehydrogenase family)